MKSAVEFHLEGMLDNGKIFPVPKSLSYCLIETDEISSEDIIAPVSI
jgi:predicted RNase H-like HicB family nuclease